MRVFTGSFETEEQIRIFLRAANGAECVPRSTFKDDYWFKVMTAGRNGKGEAYEGSQAIDDTGGFFVERDGMVYLTEKAKGCISGP